MERKIITGISLGLLFTAFGLISLLVILTKRHPYFVSKKLRLGAMIISLSGIAAGCLPTTTCYVPAPDNVFQIDQADSQTGAIVVSKAVSDTITGRITARNRDAYSFMIVDSLDTIVMKNNISPVDSVFDEAIEEFKIGFGNSLVPGNYSLRFYAVPMDSIQNRDWYNYSFSLTITD
jgi:hypothetical protein